MRLHLWKGTSAPCRRPSGWALALCGLVCAWPASVRADQGTETRLLKPLHGEVKIHWQARVREPGGTFILYRIQGDGREEVARLAADDSGDYELVDRTWRTGRSTYQLRYRLNERNESVLATSAIHLELIDSAPVTGGLSEAQPVTLATRRGTPRPSFSGSWPPSGSMPHGEWGRQPPTPPPRWRLS